MKESAERVQYITEYVVSYKAKIEALNKKGLFDTATLYELFSQKVCEIWFGHKFLNLNDSKANYPYVDLISEDGKMYVQVSTGQDIPTKVKSTLEKIRDSKSDELKSIEQLFFFVLANSSESKVMDFSGKERIGRINFIKSKNLITTENIVQKAKTDIEFQKKLYDFLFSNDLLHEFLRLTNIFSFETSILNFKYGNVYSQLKPIGMGRPCLINLIFNNGMYKEKSREKAILKLCTDYSQNPNICDEAEKSACQILQFFIEEKMKNSLKEKDFNLADGVNLCLMPIYKMAKCSHEWIKCGYY